MSWTGTDVLYERIIDALRYDLGAEPHEVLAGDRMATAPDGSDLEPLTSRVDRVLRYDGTMDAAVMDFSGAGYVGRSVYVGFADMQGAPPFLSDSTPLHADVPVEIGLMQLMDDVSQYEPLHYTLDRAMDDVLRAVHRDRRRPSAFGVSSIQFLTNVRALESRGGNGSPPFNVRSVVATFKRVTTGLVT